MERMILKDKLLQFMPEGNYILTRGGENSLYLFSEGNWERFVERITVLSKENAKAYMVIRYYISNAVEIEVNAQEEFCIPEVLWEHLANGKTNESEIDVELVKKDEYEHWKIEMVQKEDA